MKNHNSKVISDFGDEWSRFDQSNLSESELRVIFNEYFSIFPWEKINKKSIGFDLGCGTGRWAKFVAPKVAELICVEPSKAIEVAKDNLSKFKNCSFRNELLENLSIDDASMDFGYSLGVLHHIPNTQIALKQCTAKLRKGAPFLIYLYYRFDNKPLWYKAIWRLSEVLRFFISKLPKFLKFSITFFIALIIYFPLSRISLVFERLGFNVENFPLNAYRNLSFYTMKTDALDRFGTTLEQRFTKNEIYQMMTEAGLVNINFSSKKPYWCAIGFKK